MVARLVGRADELSALLAHCASEPPGAVLLTGEAGVGKTRLLDELDERLRGAGTAVLRGSAVDGGGPFRPLVRALVRAAPPSLAGSAALRPYAAVLARLLPGWPPPPPAASFHLVDPVVVLGEAVRALLATIAGDGRAVLLLDDLHWADRDTLDLLEYLCADPPPVPLVLAARDDERSPAELEAVGRHARRMRLGRLGNEHVAGLAADRTGAPVDAEVAAFLSAASGGLPFLVAELAVDLVESGSLRRDGGVWRPDGWLRARVPGAFTQLVAARVARLTEAGRTLVRTAALLGDELDWRFVATATGDDDPATGLRAAVDAGLFRAGEPDALHWRHALTRDAVLDELTPPERAELTRRAATQLEGASLTGAQLAVAADLCEQGGDRPRAAGLLLDLGREHLAAGALTAAGDVLASASALVEDGAGPAAEIAAERLRVLGLGARTDQALALGERLLPGLPEAGAARVRLQLARACVAAERWDEAATHLDGAPAGDAERLALAAHVALGRLEVDDALRLAADAAAAGRDGAPEAVCEALEITGRALRRSDPPASRAAFAEGERLAAEHGLVPWRVRALAELGTHDLFGSGDLDRLREARRLAADAGLLGTATVLDLQLTAATCGIEGHVAALPTARRCAGTATRLRLPGPAGHALMFVARGLFWAGDTDRAAATIEESLRISPNPIAPESARASADGYDAWLAHDGRTAADRLSVAVRPMRASAVSNPAPLWGHWALLSTVVYPDDPAPLEELRGSDVLVQIANRAALQYGDAVGAARAGATERSRELVEAADASLAGCNHERLFLRSLMITTEGAAAPFDPEVLLREALTRWEPAGEVRLVRWCRERMRMLGLAVPRPARDRTAVPPGLRALGVTGREMDVLRLVAGGATNADVAARLHLSPRTVETHVSNLLAKTGATARAELADRLPGPVPAP